MFRLRSGILAEAISKTHHSHRCQHHHSHRNQSHLTKQNTFPHEYKHQPLTSILHGTLTYIFNNGTAITLHQPRNPSFSGCCRNSKNQDSKGHLHHTNNSPKKLESLGHFETSPQQQRIQ